MTFWTPEYIPRVFRNAKRIQMASRITEYISQNIRNTGRILIAFRTTEYISESLSKYWMHSSGEVVN